MSSTRRVTRLEEDGIGQGGDGTRTELIVKEGFAQKVGSIRSWMGAEGVRGRGSGRRRGKGPMEERVGVEGYSMGVPGRLGLTYKD